MLQVISAQKGMWHPPTACSTLTEQPTNAGGEALCSHLGKYLHKKYLEQDICYHLKGKRWISFDTTVSGTKEKKKILKAPTPSLAFVLCPGFLRKAVHHRNPSSQW